ncbi:MAG: potassium transporter TrkG [Candidatus Thermoplasmatota archaeon]
MTLARVASAVGGMLRPFSFAFLVPALVAIVYEPHDLNVAGIQLPENAYTFVITFLAINLVAIPVGLATRNAEEEDLTDREGYLVVALGWLVLPAAASLPFILGNVHPHVLDAYVDAIAALTTTGFSTLPDPAAMDPSLLLWRALLQWLGAIGIVALGMALLAKLTHGGLKPAPLDASVQASKRLRPKMMDTARSLLWLYAGVTFALLAILVAIFLGEGQEPKQAFLEGALHVFGAFSTGGFARNAFVDDLGAASLAVLAVAMVLGATGYNVLVALRSGNWRAALRDPEWRLYLVGLVIVSAGVVFALILRGMEPADAVRDGPWATLSAMTSNGLRTASYGNWPTVVIFALGVLVFVGGCSGSAAGGLKAFRILILLKIVQRQLRILLHPRAVAPVRIGRTVLTDAAVSTAVAFTFTFVLLWIAGTLTLSLLEPGLSPMAAASGAAASLANAGLSFHGFAPGGSLAELSYASKAVVMALMWLGRLEVFAALLLFYPASWRS